jgi:RNA polymerase sigma-70 factor, ECF subfamily
MSRALHFAVDPSGADEVARDARLLARIADGDQDAFGDLWARYGRPVYALCRAALGDSAAAEDAAQETFLRIWRRAETYDAARGVPAAWIMTIARNTARTSVRPPLPASAAPLPTPGDGTDDVVDRLFLRDALGGLSEPERVTLELAYFADLSHSQVAARLGEPLGTVKARIRRALLRLGAQVAER